MRDTPAGWPRITPAVFYDDAAAAIDFLVAAFGFEVRLRIEGEGGRIEHSELEFGPDGLVQVGQTGGASHHGEPLPMVSPQRVDRQNTQALCLFVDDVDALCERAVAAGAVLVYPPTTTDYGEEYWSDRNARLVDPEGHHWWFMQRMRG